MRKGAPEAAREMDIEAPMAVILEAEPRRALLRCCVRMCVQGVPRRGTGAGLQARVGVCRAGGEGGSGAVRCLSLLGWVSVCVCVWDTALPSPSGKAARSSPRSFSPCPAPHLEKSLNMECRMLKLGYSDLWVERKKNNHSVIIHGN